MKATRPTKRETDAAAFERSCLRPIIVTVYPEGTISFRLKRSRREYTLPIEACYHLAVKAETIAIEKSKRKAKRKA